MINLIGFILTIFFIIFISALLIVGQIFLSRTKSPIPGLVLPIFLLMLILIILSTIFSYINVQRSNELPSSESIAEVSEGIWPADDNRVRASYPHTGDTSITFMIVPLYCFILDIALFVIYFVIRRSITPDKNTELKRMAVQDL